MPCMRILLFPNWKSVISSPNGHSLSPSRHVVFEAIVSMAKESSPFWHPGHPNGRLHQYTTISLLPSHLNHMTFIFTHRGLINPLSHWGPCNEHSPACQVQPCITFVEKGKHVGMQHIVKGYIKLYSDISLIYWANLIIKVLFTQGSLISNNTVSPEVPVTSIPQHNCQVAYIRLPWSRRTKMWAEHLVQGWKHRVGIEPKTSPYGSQGPSAIHYSVHT